MADFLNFCSQSEHYSSSLNDRRTFSVDDRNVVKEFPVEQFRALMPINT